MALLLICNVVYNPARVLKIYTAVIMALIGQILFSS